MDSRRILPVSDVRSVASCIEPLPPFAIRELNGPAEDGTVQISSSQYDSTITSYPDATLTYLDEDDGETVTVGSSLELRVRLDEPVRPKRRHRRRSDPLSRSADSDQKIHIFDINRTAENLLVWRDHAAYSSKTLRESSGSTSSLPLSPSNTDSSPVKPQTLPKDTSVSAPFIAVEPSTILPTREQPTRPEPTTQSDHVLKGIDEVLQTACKGFESHIGGFAAFLDLTSGALRTAAEKTREADTTPVEDFLRGMKTVLVEAGQMGLELLRELEIDVPAPTAASIHSVEQKSAPASPVESVRGQLSESSSNRVSFSFPGARPSSGSNASLRSYVPPPHDATTIQGKVQSNSVLPIDSLPTTTSPAKDSPADIITFQQPSSTPNHSLMDIDAWNEDFAVRYPPLNSLRRAKTVGSLRKPADPEVQRESGDESKATLTRYPTIGQIDRTNRQERIARMRSNRTSLFPRFASLESPRRPESSSQQYKSPDVEDVNGADTVISNPTNRGNGSTGTDAEHGLPGAWPERTAAVGDSGATEPPGSLMEQLAKFSSGMSGNPQPRSPALSCRTTSPLADPFHPAVGALRRAKTVTASNPAARLNGPFDPLSGAPGPLDEAAVPTHDPFGQFTLPQRSFTQHLPSGLDRPAFRGTHRPVQLRGPRPLQRDPSSMPGAFPYPSVPQPRATPTGNQFLRHIRSEPNCAPAAARPTTDPGVTDCISSLRAMGYGSGDANEDARLPMYASATFGNVSEAIEMIEEDRRAAKAILSRV